MKQVLAVLLLGASLVCSNAAAQGVVQIMTPAGNMVAVPVIVTPGLGDIARGGNGRVLVDPYLMTLPFEFQQLVFAHEGAHAIGIMNEAQADYFAGVTLRIAGFTPNQMQTVFACMLQFLSPMGDGRHPPSRQRVGIVQAGYASQ